MLALIPTGHIEQVWPLAEPWIEKACRRIKKFSAQDVKHWLLVGENQLWLDSEAKAVIVSQIAVYPNKKTFYINIATGKDRESWQGDIVLLEAWAKSQGCQSMELVARPGWKRILKGYRMTHVFLEREL